MNLLELLPKYLSYFLHISGIFCTFVPTNMSNKNTSIMQQNQSLVIGRMELAQLYFPYIQPRSAWLKLKSLLSEDPGLEHLTKMKRRTFLPAEVNIIYQHLGQP
jgi:hypothetical protein